jgi:catechol 2,3-dioxygenase-like lactoylglutathione lyase family enzyme
MSSPDPTLITFLYVSDLSASNAFYAGALGLDLAVDQGDCLIYRINEGAYLGVCSRPDRLSVGGLITTIVTDDVEGLHERLVAAGARVEAPPEHSARYRITHAFYRDPDGHLVEVQRFDDPNWADPSPAD